MEIQNQKTKTEIIFPLILGFIFLFILSIGFISALPGSPPPLPDYFYGNVTLYGDKAENGTQIKVYVAGNLEKIYNMTETGQYGLYVKTGEEGENIEFKIQDKIAGTSSRSNGDTIYLNLELTNTPAPTPSSPSSGGSSGGGGGGGSSSYPTTNHATNTNLTNIENLEDSSSGDGSNEKTENQNKTNLSTTKISKITGAVIEGITEFTKTKKGISMIIIMLTISLGVILTKFKFKKFKPLKKWIEK